MNTQVVSQYNEYLKLTGGDNAAAAGLTLAAALRDCRPAAAEPVPPTGALTVAEAASRLRVSPWTIYRLACTGKLPSYRAGSGAAIHRGRDRALRERKRRGPGEEDRPAVP